MEAREFMVATANPLATEVGHAVLAAGGSAADAAVAVQVMLNLVEPQNSGLSGGFLLYWNAATGTLTSFDGRERAPLAADDPSSGALTIGQILGMLEGFDLAELGDGPEAAHLFAEASRLAFADRGLYMADADFVDMPHGLLDPDYLAERAALIETDSSMGEAEAGEPPWDEAMRLSPDQPRPRQGTTHFVIVDRYGDMVSATTTIEAGFGSRVMTGGFLLNNELTDFSRDFAEDNRLIANRVEGGKRPRSSMSPTIVLEDGEPVLLTGCRGVRRSFTTRRGR